MEFDSSSILYSTGELWSFFSTEVANCDKLCSVLWAVATGDWTKLDLPSNPTVHGFLGQAATHMMVTINMVIYDTTEIYFDKQK